MLKINEAVEVKVLLLDKNGAPVAGTIAYVVYDEADASFATGNMTVVAGVTGFYTMTFTPDAAGEWTVKLSCGDPVRNATKVFFVGKGIEAEIKTETALIKTETDKIPAHITALATHDVDIKALLVTAQADLDNPNQYKADISALALEATLGTHDVDIKALLEHGTYGLSAIETLVDTLETVLGTKTDVADVDGTVTAKQQTLFANLHRYIGMIVADKTSLHANTTIVKTALEKKFHVDVLDDDDIDSGDADLDIYDIIFICGTVTDMTKINEITTLGVPVLTCNPEAALTILRLGDDSGGSGTSWDELAGQTQVNIVNNTHQVVLTQTTGNLTVYDSASTVTWLRKTDLVAGVVQIAEVAGDNAKVTIALLPYDVNDEDGNPAPMPRLYWGINDPSSWNTVAENLFFDMIEWLLHQGRRTVEVEGIGKINQINQKLGTELSNADNLYDYIVTGANEAGVFPAITANKVGSVLERIEALMQKDTAPAFDSDTDSLEAISEALATHVTALGTHDTDMKADFDRHITWVDFWSDASATVTITGGSTDVNLPDVIIPTLPTGATIWKVVLLFKCAIIRDTSTSDNAINGAAAIRIKKSSGSWGVDDIIAYDIVDNLWLVDVSTCADRGGDAFIGNMNNDDLSSEVDAAATYNLRFEDIQADGGNLVLYEVCVGLRVYFY